MFYRCIVNNRFSSRKTKSAPSLLVLVTCPFETCLFGSGPIAWPPDCCSFPKNRSPRPNFTLDTTALAGGLSNTPAQCEVDRMSTYIRTETVDVWIGQSWPLGRRH